MTKGASTRARRQRILFVNRFFWPDVSATSQILSHLCGALPKDAAEVHVVTSRLRYDEPAVRFPARQTWQGVKIHRLWSTGFGRRSAIGRLCDYLSFYAAVFVFLLMRSRADDLFILKTDPPLLSVVGWLAQRLVPLRMIAWCQDIFPEIALAEVRAGRLVNGVFTALVHWRDSSWRACERVVVIGEDMAQFVRQRGVDGDRLAIIPNASVQVPDAGAKSPAGLRREWGFREDDFVVGYSGNLGRVHDIDTFWEAVISLPERCPVRFLFIGGGAGYQELQARAVASAHAGRFVFLPYQPLEDLAASLQVPDVHWLSLKSHLSAFVYPSKFAGILQAGRAVLFVGSPDFEIARLIRRAGIGHAVSEGDAAALRKALESMLADPHGVSTMGKSAQQLWRNNVDPGTCVGRWIRLFEGLRNQPHQQDCPQKWKI